MALPKKHGGKQKKPIADILPEMLSSAIARQDDFILTFETNPDTGRKHIHVMTGQFVSACMLRKLTGQAESQRDEGSVIVTRAWKPDTCVK
jgi:hypothetical protein